MQLLEGTNADYIALPETTLEATEESVAAMPEPAEAEPIFEFEVVGGDEQPDKIITEKETPAQEIIDVAYEVVSESDDDAVEDEGTSGEGSGPSQHGAGPKRMDLR